MGCTVVSWLRFCGPLRVSVRLQGTLVGRESAAECRTELGSVSDVEDAVEAGQERRAMALFQVDNFGGVTNFDFVREMTDAEYERLTEAGNFVRRVARMTPYHSLDAARARYLESLSQAVANSTEDVEVRRTRCAAALGQLFTVVAGHGDEWRPWVADVLGRDVEEVPSTVDEAVEAFTGSTAAQAAEQLASASDGVLELFPGEEPDALVRSEIEGLQVRVGEWLANLEQQTLLVMDAGLQAVKVQLDDASRFVLNLAAEVMTGSPIVAPKPTNHGWDPKFEPSVIDVAAVRAAQSLEWRVRTFATQIRDENRSSEQAPSPSQAAAGSTGDGEGLEEEEQDDAEPVELPSVMVNLHRVIDAMVDNVDGLVSQWAQKFPAEEFAQALEIERAQVPSLIQPWQRALEAESAVAGEAGYPNTLPGYPVALDEMAAWSSAAPVEQLWTYQSAATVHAFQLYVAALEDLGKPSKLKFERGKVLELEFNPLRAAALHASARLLVELTEENAVTLAGLTGKDLDELGVAPASDYLVRQLVRAVKTSQAFGLPEVLLVYALRLLSVLDFRADESEAKLLEAAKAEVIRYISGEATSRGVALMLADALVHAGDKALAQGEIDLGEDWERRRGDGQAQPSDRGTTPDNDPAAVPHTREGNDD